MPVLDVVRRTLRSGSRTVAVLVALASTVAIAACGGEPQQEQQMEAEEEPAATGEPRVFFQQPQDGDTVTSPTKVVFGSENVEVAAVPDTVETPREGVIHYHLGYDTECLPPDSVIPDADPWIHFGDGSNQIEMQFPEPGEYQLSVQAGDDEHRTIEGLCQTITVTVAESSN